MCCVLCFENLNVDVPYPLATENPSDVTLQALSTALRYMNRDEVVEELEEQMSAVKSQRQQETARTLLAEMGGTAAMKKLSARSNVADKYAQVTAKVR